MQFPQVKHDVDPWVDAILRAVHDPRQRAAELAIARQILLATYGHEPSDQVARTFVEDQIWYAPAKGFSLSNLSSDQKAVLAEFDSRAQSINQGK
jgi:hypothetical protein